MGIWKGQSFLIRLNGNQVPDVSSYPGIWPERIEVHYPTSNERTLNGLPAGFAGFPSAILTWQTGMSAIAYQWWLGFTTSSVVLTDLVLPDSHAAGSVIYNHGTGNKTYLLHSQWDYSVMERITPGIGSHARWLNGAQWRTGPLSVRFWNLGGG